MWPHYCPNTMTDEQREAMDEHSPTFENGAIDIEIDYNKIVDYSDSKISDEVAYDISETSRVLCSPGNFTSVDMIPDNIYSRQV